MPGGPAASRRRRCPQVGAGRPAPRRQRAGRPRRAWRVRQGRSGGGDKREAGKSCSAAAGPAAEAGPAESGRQRLRCGRAALVPLPSLCSAVP